MRPETTRVPLDYLDGDMTRAELRTVLEDLPFSQHRNFVTVQLDKDVRDLLVALLR